MSIRDLIYKYTNDKATISHGLAFYQQGGVKNIKINSVDYDLNSTLPYASTIIADAQVGGDKPFLVMRDDHLLSFNCTCSESHNNDQLCKHLVALVRALSDILVPTQNKTDQRAINDLLAHYRNNKIFSPSGDGTANESIQLIPTLDFDPYSRYFSLEFHVGTSKKFYVIKSISTFYAHLLKGDTVSYGKQLTFCHTRANFDNASQFYLDLIDNAFEWMNYGRGSFMDGLPKIGRYLHLTHSQFDQLFTYVSTHSGEILTHQSDGSTAPLRMLSSTPDTTVQIITRSSEEYLLGLSMSNYNIYHNNQITYLYNEHCIIKPNDGYQQHVVPLLDAIKSPSSALVLNSEQLTAFLSTVVPLISPHVKLEMEAGLEARLAPPALRIHLILDYPQKNTIRGRLYFHYGPTAFNPLAEEELPAQLLRDIDQENHFAAQLVQYRFSVNEDEWLLVGEDAIYEFLHEGLPALMPLADIDIEATLTRIRPRTPQMPHMDATVTKGMLEVKFDETLYDKEVLINVLKAYRAGKKFVRLTDDTYIDILHPDVHAIDALLHDCAISLKDFDDSDTFELPLYRAITLDTFDGLDTAITFNRREAFDALLQTIRNEGDLPKYPLPKGLHATLRSYQLTGYQWLVHLSKLGFGGILADDMGLGKTLQTIAYLLHQHEENPKARSIIVMPTSLLYNWESELVQFAPSLKFAIVSGTKKERAALLTDIPEGIILLTSYATLRRDSALYDQYTFDNIISDEGQYIKNSYTQNTKSLKNLHGRHHFSLTGTPIENSLADLWSIMDFCMPGYLHSWREFRNTYEVPITRYEDTARLEQLKAQIAPFILRRVKTDVLTELPDKIDTVLYANLSEEEKHIYHTQLALSHKAFIEEIADGPVGQARIRVLTLLMRLRQVCCSPSLFLSGFDKPSAKLSLCLSVIEDRIAAGSQMLVFSQFTSVLHLIAPELEKRGIPYLMLTGQTKSKDRMTLVNQFNDEKIPVFLISLKAGGVGLNLTSADTVIHFDPWWNQSVENQATDRTHRIGQKKSVNVIRLIVKDTIEEKILKLKEKKQQLSDAVITSEENVISKLTMDDLENLFALDYGGFSPLPGARPTRTPYTIED